MSIDDLRVRWRQALSLRGLCLRCGSARVWHNGVRRRTACLLDGECTVFVDDIPVRRLRCGDCNLRFCHAPERVSTRAHQQPCVVGHAVAEAVVDRDATRAVIARAHRCHRRTLHRFVERVAAVAEPAQLASKLLVEAAAPTLPAAPALRPSRSARFCALAARAMSVLALLEALVSLRGLEPPALAHARLFVPANAPPTATPSRAVSEV